MELLLVSARSRRIAKLRFTPALVLLLCHTGIGPNIRVGGNSADESVYMPGTAPLPSGDDYRITDTDFEIYLLAVPQWGGSLTLGKFTSTFLNASSCE